MQVYTNVGHIYIYNVCVMYTGTVDNSQINRQSKGSEFFPT